MSPLRSCAAAAVSFVALAPLMNCAHAQTARSGGSPNAQLLQQMQQLASERTSLQLENTKLKKDLEDLRKERDSLKNAQQALDKRVKLSEASVKTLQENVGQRRESTDRELAASKEKMDQLIAKFRETLQTMRDVETERTSAKQSLAQRDEQLQVCVDRNLALYKLNQEVLARLEHQGAWSRVARAEPFTQIKRVELENLVEEYKEKADDQRVKANGGPAATSAPPRTPTLIAAPGPTDSSLRESR